MSNVCLSEASENIRHQSSRFCSTFHNFLSNQSQTHCKHGINLTVTLKIRLFWGNNEAKMANLEVESSATKRVYWASDWEGVVSCRNQISHGTWFHFWDSQDRRQSAEKQKKRQRGLKRHRFEPTKKIF